MTSTTTAIQQEVLLPTHDDDQPFQYRRHLIHRLLHTPSPPPSPLSPREQQQDAQWHDNSSNNNKNSHNAHNQHHGSDSDHALQPVKVKDQYLQVPSVFSPSAPAEKAQKRDSIDDCCCCCWSDTPDELVDDPPQWQQLHQQEQGQQPPRHLQSQLGPQPQQQLASRSTQQDSWTGSGSRSSIDAPLPLSLASPSPCFPTSSATTVVVDSPSLLFSPPSSSSSHAPCGYGCPCLSTPLDADQQQRLPCAVGNNTPSSSITPSSSNSAYYPAATTTTGTVKTEAAIGFSHSDPAISPSTTTPFLFAQQRQQLHAAAAWTSLPPSSPSFPSNPPFPLTSSSSSFSSSSSTERTSTDILQGSHPTATATESFSPSSHLRPVHQISRPHSTNSSQSFLTSCSLSSSSSAASSLSFLSSSTSLPLSLSTTRPPTLAPSPHSSAPCHHCTSCPDSQQQQQHQPFIGPKALCLGQSSSSFFAPSSSSPSTSPVSGAGTPIPTTTPTETTVTITTTDINCRCPPEKLASCPHQLSLPSSPSSPSTATSLPHHQQQQQQQQQLTVTPSLIYAEIQPLRYFRPQEDNQNHNTNTADDSIEPFPIDLEIQVQNSLDYLYSLETYPLSEQEVIKKSLLKRKKRPQSWIALKEFVSNRVLGHHKERNSKQQHQECPTPTDRPPLLSLGHNRNRSTPLLGNHQQQGGQQELLRSPSPSPSLPVTSSGVTGTPRSAPNSFSRATSRLLRTGSARWSEDSQPQQQLPCARARSSPPANSSTVSLPNHHNFGGHASATRPSMRDWTTTSLVNIRAPRSRATSPQPSIISPSPISPPSSPRSSSPPPHSYTPFQQSPRTESGSSPTHKAATLSPSTSFSQLQSLFEPSTASVPSTGSTISSSSLSYNQPPHPQTLSSTSMSNYASSSMSSLSTLSAASNVSPMLSPSPSNISLFATLPRSPLRKTATGGQHPLATVSTFESDPATAINEVTESVEADKSSTDTQQPTVDSSAVGVPSTLSESIQLSLKDAAPSLKDTSLDHPKSRLFSEGQRQTGSSNIDKKQEDLRVLKSAVLSGSHSIPMLQIKAGTQSRDLELAAAVELGDNQETSDPDWESVAVTFGNTQPLSPLTASYPVSIHRPLVPSSISVNTSADESAPTESVAESEPQTQTLAETTQTTATSSPVGATTVTAPSEPKREFEMWMPPPPRPRQTQDTHRAQPQPQHHSRLHFPRLLKQRSFNFPFTTSSSSASGTSSLQSGSSANPASRASVDGGSSSRSEGQDPTERTASCDIPRPVGPPDPIPPHYQHLQNRQNRRSSSFRRRSHAGELERFSPGWVVVENSHQGGSQTGGATSPTRASMSDDQTTAAASPEAHQRRSSATTSRRHVSLGVQPHLTSMWGRLLTSILPSGNEHHQHAQDTDSAPLRDRDNSAAASALPLSGNIDPYLQQQRLLLTPLSQQQQIHPLYQQQLFFYADEVVSEPARRISESSDPPCFQSGSEDASNNQPRQSMANESLRSSDSLSFFPALAHNAHLQGELAQEDGRDSLEMSSSDSGASMRPDSFFGPAVAVGTDTILSPRLLSADGKIPVSSLALSQPPSYWEAEIKYKGWPKIVPRPELGQEALPRYTCSVFREGCVNRKTELVGNWRPYRRPWKRTFAHLRGTALRLYAVDMEDVPRLHVRNISLQLAKCEIATDYKQRPNVIRIRACDRTVLIECKDRVDALTWLEHLQAAANIATSLEDRSMPKFYTLPRAPPQSLQQQQGSRSAASSNAQSSGAGSNVSARNHQQTPQPLPPVQPLLAQQLQLQQRRASVVPMIASPRSSTEADAGAGSERQVRRSRSGELLTTTTTRSERNSSGQERRERGRRINDALSDEAVLRNVLRALGHSPESNSGSSPSTDENEVDEEDDSEDDEDDGQATDVEADPSSAASMTAVAAQGSTRHRRSAGHRCGGTCHHHHNHSHGRSHGRRGHHHHDHNMTVVVAGGPAVTSVIATDDEGGQPPAGGRRSEDHSGLETPTSRRSLPRLVTSPSAQTAARQQQRASWNRRLFGGLWNHHHDSSSSQQQQQQQHTPEPLAAAT